MILLRVVGKDGKGFYNSMWDKRKLWEVMSNDLDMDINSITPRRPSPEEDGIYFRSCHRFAFMDIQQARSWFDPTWWEYAAVYGIEVEEWETHSRGVLPGRKQVAFDPEHATLKSRKCISHYIK